MTFVTDPRVVAYRIAVNNQAPLSVLQEAQTGFAAYLMQTSPTSLRMTVARVLAREGFSRQALADTDLLTGDQLDSLPAPDRGENDRVSGLRAMPYIEYLQTDHWHFTRRLALERAKGHCSVCNGTRSLEVHHRTYERRGEELPEDLVVLCNGCHDLFHEHGKLAA